MATRGFLYRVDPVGRGLWLEYVAKRLSVSCYTLLVLCLVSYHPSAIALASASGFLTQKKVSFWNSLTLTRVQASHHVFL